MTTPHPTSTSAYTQQRTLHSLFFTLRYRVEQLRVYHHLPATCPPLLLLRAC